MLTSNRLSPNEPLGAGIGDTVYYEPVNDVLIRYRAQRYLAIRALAAETSSGFAQFATRIKEQLGQEGTWRDAEDGELAREVCRRTWAFTGVGQVSETRRKGVGFAGVRTPHPRVGPVREARCPPLATGMR